MGRLVAPDSPSLGQFSAVSRRLRSGDFSLEIQMSRTTDSLQFWFCLITLVIPLHSGAQERPKACLSPAEAQLAKLINDYRVAEGHQPVPVSRSLTEVAQWHAWDLSINPNGNPACTLFSWSEAGLGLWNPGCLQSDLSEIEIMWDKPAEITSGVYSNSGFELIAFSSSSQNPAAFLSLWQASQSNNELLLNEDLWAGFDPWPAMGVAIKGNYATAWFGGLADPQGIMTECPELDLGGVEIVVAPTEESDADFGWSLGRGDFDGDGQKELAVGAPGGDVGGAVDVFGLPAETRLTQDSAGWRRGRRSTRQRTGCWRLQLRSGGRCRRWSVGRGHSGC